MLPTSRPAGHQAPRRDMYPAYLAVVPIHCLCHAQRAMNLSPEQKQTLREETARAYARSAALHRERTALLRQLDVQLISEKGANGERIMQVNARNWML